MTTMEHSENYSPTRWSIARTPASGDRRWAAFLPTQAFRRA